MILVVKGDIKRIIKRNVTITEGEVEVTDTGIHLKHKGLILDGETRVIRLPHKIQLKHGQTALVTMNPYLYEIGNITGPTYIHEPKSEIFFRYEAAEDLKFADLEYIVKLVFTKDN